MERRLLCTQNTAFFESGEGLEPNCTQNRALEVALCSVPRNCWFSVQSSVLPFGEALCQPLGALDRAENIWNRQGGALALLFHNWPSVGAPAGPYSGWFGSPSKFAAWKKPFCARTAPHSASNRGPEAPFATSVMPKSAATLLLARNTQALCCRGSQNCGISKIRLL